MSWGCSRQLPNLRHLRLNLSSNSASEKKPQERSTRSQHFASLLPLIGMSRAMTFQPDNIPLLNGRVLVNVRHYCEGTHLGIVQRASQLMTDYIAHRRFPGLEYLLFRDRADLFDRVQKRVLEHKKFLENKELALNDKFKSVSSQCEILIRDVKNGMI